LTGRRAFEGNTVSATSASIQEAEPDWGMLPGSTPLELRHLLQQCLEKDAKLRPRSASELRRKIESHSAPRKVTTSKASLQSVTPKTYSFGSFTLDSKRVCLMREGQE